ncbi:MAG TPA: hypothetical protein DDX75_00765 [Phycisphaerales bacterium]|nr:hypothetical protein [Phycisphaerales bacterium]
MTQDFIRYGTLGGKYAGIPSHVVSLFEERNLNEEINKPLILNYLNGREEKWPTALQYINYYIELFRQWAYRQADDNTALLAEIDNYIKDLYNLIEKAKNKTEFDDIELIRLETLKTSLTEKLDDYLAPRLINAGQDGVNELLQNVDNNFHIDSYPCKSETKWLNEDIIRISLLLEKIKLVEKLIKKVSPESREKYLLLNRLDDLKSCFISWIGILERSRDNEQWAITDENADTCRKEFQTLMSNIKELNNKLNLIIKKNRQQPAVRQMKDVEVENLLKGYASTVKYLLSKANTAFFLQQNVITLSLEKIFSDCNFGDNTREMFIRKYSPEYRRSGDERKRDLPEYCTKLLLVYDDVFCKHKYVNLFNEAIHTFNGIIQAGKEHFLGIRPRRYFPYSLNDFFDEYATPAKRNNAFILARLEDALDVVIDNLKTSKLLKGSEIKKLKGMITNNNNGGKAIADFLWKLYENTLKIVFDVVVDKVLKG